MYNELVKAFQRCGFNEKEAVRELESIIRYHTTGIDAVSREYAIEMIYNDMFNDEN